MKKYQIVLFKNKKKKKVIKSYATETNALKKYNKLIKENIVPFEVFFENHDECFYEIAIIGEKKVGGSKMYKVDDIGRNEEVFIKNSDDFSILHIHNYKIEELIFDWQTDERIRYEEFLKKYFKDKDLKVVSTLYNKIIIQKNDDFNLFSLKNSQDSERLLQVLEKFFIDNKRNDGIFVRDNSNTQRKWLYKILVEKGFDKKRLYRQKTTFSKRT